MKIAIVHDWLYTNGGAEKVLENIIEIFPNADLYSLVDFVPENQRLFLKGKKVFTSFIQKLPFAKSGFRYYLPLMPFAIEQFDLGKYDIIISSSYAIAKGVLTHSEQFHICYCHSPIRYAWDLYHQYMNESNLRFGPKGLFARFTLHYLRLWDVSTSNKVDFFVANSQFIAKRIKRVYRRTCAVIYPPVAIDKFELVNIKQDYYLTASRFVPYKRIDLIVDTFNKMPDKKLFVIGDGADYKQITNKKYNNNIQFLGYQSNDELKKYMQNAKAFVFAAKEDFGIVPVEALACGTPVIAFGSGGCLETIIPNITGVLFQEQSIQSLLNAIEEFEKNISLFNPIEIRKFAEKFNSERFKLEFKNILDIQYEKFKS